MFKEKERSFSKHKSIYPPPPPHKGSLIPVPTLYNSNQELSGKCQIQISGQFFFKPKSCASRMYVIDVVIRQQYLDKILSLKIKQKQKVEGFKLPNWIQFISSTTESILETKHHFHLQGTFAFQV